METNTYFFLNILDDKNVYFKFGPYEQQEHLLGITSLLLNIHNSSLWYIEESVLEINVWRTIKIHAGKASVDIDIPLITEKELY